MLPVQPAAVAQANSRPGVVQITGRVTDASGRSLSDLQVVLEASHRSFDFSTLTRVERGQTRRTTRTDARGEFSLRWYPNDYFNQFDLKIGMTVRVPDGDQFYTLEQRSLDGLQLEEGPLAVDVTVADTSFLLRYRSFVAGLDSEDEHKVYSEMGIPAKIDRIALATHEEVTWWYFEAGKAFRFKNGGLAEVSRFEPVEPFGEESDPQ